MFSDALKFVHIIGMDANSNVIKISNDFDIFSWIWNLPVSFLVKHVVFMYYESKHLSFKINFYNIQKLWWLVDFLRHLYI